MTKKVTITEKQRKKYSAIGNNLIKKKLTSGFQIEDFSPNKKKKTLIYAHDNPKHLTSVNKKLKGKRFPRESYYKWDSEWKVGENTNLLFNNSLAYGKEEYISTKPSKNKMKFIKKRLIYSKSEKPYKASWDCPDVRLYNTPKRKKDFKTAWLITKKIDNNSRIATITTRKSKIAKIRKAIPNKEKVTKIKIQNYHPKNTKYSLWKFIRD